MCRSDKLYHILRCHTIMHIASARISPRAPAQANHATRGTSSSSYDHIMHSACSAGLGDLSPVDQSDHRMRSGRVLDFYVNTSDREHLRQRHNPIAKTPFDTKFLSAWDICFGHINRLLPNYYPRHAGWAVMISSSAYSKSCFFAEWKYGRMKGWQDKSEAGLWDGSVYCQY